MPGRTHECNSRDHLHAFVLSLILFAPLAVLNVFWMKMPALIGALFLFTFLLHLIDSLPKMQRYILFPLFLLFLLFFMIFENRLSDFFASLIYTDSPLTPRPILSLSRVLFEAVWPTGTITILSAGIAIVFFLLRTYFWQTLFSLLPNTNFEWMGRFLRQATTHFTDFVKIELLQWVTYTGIIVIAFVFLGFSSVPALALLVSACVLVPYFGVWLIPVLLGYWGFDIFPSLLQAVGMIITFAVILFLRYGLFFEMIYPLEERLPKTAIIAYAALGFLLLGFPGILIFPPVGSILYLIFQDFIENKKIYSQSSL